mgnify:CR=1 FL=1
MYGRAKCIPLAARLWVLGVLISWILADSRDLARSGDELVSGTGMSPDTYVWGGMARLGYTLTRRVPGSGGGDR